MISLFFTQKEVIDFESAKTSDQNLFGQYFNQMLENGIYIAPSQFESLFVSTALTTDTNEKVDDQLATDSQHM